MKKDTHLVNIYLKIHNKRTLTMDDLRYLAQHAPDCFEKTCQNVVYNFPKAKPIMNPSTTAPAPTANTAPTTLPAPIPQREYSESQHIEAILENLKRLEAKEFPLTNVEADEVKNLLGNLYMELLFPHNDKDTFFNLTEGDSSSTFDAKA